MLSVDHNYLAIGICYFIDRAPRSWARFAKSMAASGDIISRCAETQHHNQLCPVWQITEKSSRAVRENVPTKIASNKLIQHATARALPGLFGFHFLVIEPLDC